MSQPRQNSLLSGIQAVRLFWSVHNQRRRSSQLSQLAVGCSATTSVARLLTWKSFDFPTFQRSQNGSTDDDDDVSTCAVREDSLVEPKICRICLLSDDTLVENICDCKGSIGFIHERCLRLWTVYQRSQVCEICRCKFRWDWDAQLSIKQYDGSRTGADAN